jgi:hypothetical protein
VRRYQITGRFESKRVPAARGRSAAELGLDAVVAAAWQLLGTCGVIAHDDAFSVFAAAAARAAAPGDRIVEAFVLQGTDSFQALVNEDRARAVTTATAAMALLRDQSGSAPSEFRGMWALLLAVEHDDGAPDAIDEVQRSGVGVNRLNLGYLAYARAVLAGRSDAAAAAEFVAAGDRDLLHGPFWHHSAAVSW